MTRVKINDKVCDFDLCFKKKKGKENYTPVLKFSQQSFE